MDRDELVQYYIINSELNMSVGKIAGQVAHVATIISLDSLCFQENKLWVERKKTFIEWYTNHNQKKIILRGKTKDLLKLKEEGFYYIEDLGLTEIPTGSLTCVGLGVMRKSETQQYIKRLQLL